MGHLASRWHLLALVLVGCGPRVSSDEEANLAYIGLDAMLGKALGLGLDGFNAADSANIPDQSTEGDVSGTLVVGGQVDQGASDNKGLRLEVSLDDYADEVTLSVDAEDGEEDDDEELEVRYRTEQPLALELQLRDIPDGTLQGTLAGTVWMEGDLEDEVDLDLSLDGDIEDDGAGAVRRVQGSTAITGTVTTAGGGTYTVDVTR